MKRPGGAMAQRDMWTVSHREDPTSPGKQQSLMRNPDGVEVDTAAADEVYAIIRGTMRDEFKVVVSKGSEVVRVLHDTMPLNESRLKEIHNRCITDPSNPGRAVLWGRDVTLGGEQVREVQKLLATVEQDLNRYKSQVALWPDFQRALDARRAVYGEFSESSEIVVDNSATTITTRNGDHGTEILVPTNIHALYTLTIKHKELTDDLRRYQIANDRVAGDLYGTAAQNFGLTIRQLYAFHQAANNKTK